MSSLLPQLQRLQRVCDEIADLIFSCLDGWYEALASALPLSSSLPSRAQLDEVRHVCRSLLESLTSLFTSALSAIWTAPSFPSSSSSDALYFGGAPSSPSSSSNSAASLLLLTTPLLALLRSRLALITLTKIGLLLVALSYLPRLYREVRGLSSSSSSSLHSDRRLCGDPSPSLSPSLSSSLSSSPSSAPSNFHFTPSDATKAPPSPLDDVSSVLPSSRPLSPAATSAQVTSDTLTHQLQREITSAQAHSASFALPPKPSAWEGAVQPSLVTYLSLHQSCVTEGRSLQKMWTNLSHLLSGITEASFSMSLISSLVSILCPPSQHHLNAQSQSKGSSSLVTRSAL